MKTARKRLTAAISAAAMTLSMFSGIPIGSIPSDLTAFTADAAVKTQCQTYAGSNANSQAYTNWSNPIDSYLTVLSDGGFMRFQNGAADGKYLIEYYDADYNIQDTIRVEAELPVFGGFYAAGEYYFVLSGQTNREESAEMECYRITKYDKDWNRLDSAGMYDCDTTVPFDAGCARFAVNGNQLYIHTSHEMYESSDGYNHQSNYGMTLDIETMALKEGHTTNQGYADYGYTSHSFNQFIKMDGDTLVTVDHGDAFPRSIVLQIYPNSSQNEINVVTFPGNTGNNYTGASVGGFEASDTSYLVAYTAESLDDGTLDNTTRNISIGVVDKATREVTIQPITDYADGSASASTPHLVKISDDSFVVLWSQNGTVYYTGIDGEGNCGTIYTMKDAVLSDCVPVVLGDKLVWYTWNDKVNTFCDIDVNDLSQHSVTVIENGHQTELVSTPDTADGEYTVNCTQCGEEFSFVTPSDVSIWWHRVGNTMTSTAMPQLYIGDTVEYSARFEGDYDERFNDYEVTISDPENVIVEQTGLNEGKITALKEGKYTVNFTHKYDSKLDRTYIVQFNHYKDHTLIKHPAPEGSNIAVKECQDCDYTEEFTVVSNFTVYWERANGSYSTKFDNLHCPDTSYGVIAYTSGSADNRELTIEIADPEIASFRDSEEYYYELSGMLEFHKEGTTDIIIYPTYNPSAKQTFTLTVGHDFEDGVCLSCGYTCTHESGSSVAANCQSGAICAVCGMDDGQIDPSVHASEELYYEQSEESDSEHNVFHACCDQLFASEPHEFALNEDTGAYTCICSAEAVALIETEDGITYYSDLSNALDDAATLSESTIKLLTDLCADPFTVDAGVFTLDLNGKDLSFTGADENGYAAALDGACDITVIDSIGNGSMTAPENAVLFGITDGLLRLESGNLIADGTVIEAQGGSLDVSDINITGKCGISLDKLVLTLLGTPEFDCTDADFVLSENALMSINTDLGENCYTLQKEGMGVFASKNTDAPLNPEWFTFNENGKIAVLEENGDLSLKYDLTAADASLEYSEVSYNGAENLPNISVQINGTEAEYNVSYADADGNPVDTLINAGSYTVIITGINDYVGTLELPYHITDAVPELAWAKESEALIYNGESPEITPVEITLQGKDIFEGEVHYSYRIADSSDEFIEGLPVNAGSYEIIAAIDAFDNYTSAETEEPLLLTIGKAAAPEIVPAELSYAFTDSDEKTIELPELPKDMGKLGKASLEVIDPDSLLNTTKTISYKNHTFTFTAKENSCDAFGKTAEITVTIPSQNYEDITLRAIITMDKGVLNAEDFTYAAEEFAYDGKEKTALLSPVDGISGAGEITLHYFDEDDKETTPIDAGVYTFSASIAEGEYYCAAELSSAEWTFRIEESMIDAVSPVLTAPAVGEKPQNTLKNGEGWTADSITWDCETETFDFNTAYTVKLTLNADDNYQFAEDITAEGFTVLENDHKTLILEKTYDATAKAKITKLTAPSDLLLNAHYENAAEVIKLLPASIAIAAEDGTDALDIAWEANGNYDSAANAANTFTWTAQAGDLDANEFALEGTITVTNADYIDVSELIELSVANIVYGDIPAPAAEYNESTSFQFTYSRDGKSYTELSELYDQNELLPVGDYFVRAAYESATEKGSTTEKFSVTPFEIIISPDPMQSKVYSTEEPTLAYKHTELFGDDAITGKLLREEGEDAGQYAYRISELDAGKNYVLVLSDTSDSFTITKGIPSIEEPSATPLIYGQALSEIELPKGWSWLDETIIPNVNNDGYKAGYVIADDINYDYSDIEGYDAKTHEIIRTIPVSVSKADPLVTPLLVGTKFKEGDELPEIRTSEDDTPGTIGWINPDDQLEMGKNILEWNFTPEDAENYNEMTGTAIVMAEQRTTTTTTTTATETTTTTPVTTTTTTETTTTTPDTTTTKVGS